MAQFQIKWQAPEFEYREKTVSWYWISIIVAALVIGFSVWEKNFLFGLFVVIAEMLFIVWGNKTPRTIGFVMDENGINIEGGKSYQLKELETVSVDVFGDGWVELVFVFRAKLRTPLKILFPESQLQELRSNIKALLKEVPYEPTLLDSIEKLLRF